MSVQAQANRVHAREPSARRDPIKLSIISFNNDMHAVKLASKTRFSFVCAQFLMIHDYILCDVKSRALRRSVSNLLLHNYFFSFLLRFTELCDLVRLGIN